MTLSHFVANDIVTLLLHHPQLAETLCQITPQLICYDSDTDKMTYLQYQFLFDHCNELMGDNHDNPHSEA